MAVIRAVLILHSHCSQETKNQFLREGERYIGTVLKIIGKLVFICTLSPFSNKIDESNNRPQNCLSFALWFFHENHGSFEAFEIPRPGSSLTFGLS
jgi:hypothetical protein